MPKNRLNIDRAIISLRRLKVNIPNRQASYSCREVGKLLACDDGTVVNLVRRKYLDALTTQEETGIVYHIFHLSLISFLTQRNKGIKRDMEEVLFEGLVRPETLATKLGCTHLYVDDLARTEKLPSFNISASREPGENPYYSFPRIETIHALSELRKKRPISDEEFVKIFLTKGRNLEITCRAVGYQSSKSVYGRLLRIEREKPKLIEQTESELFYR